MDPHPAYQLLRPAAGSELPIVLDSPHSGTEWPADFDSLLDETARRDAEDCFVDRLYAHAPQHGATLLAARFPRLYIDPNRALTEIDELLLDAPWPGEVIPSPKTRLGFGLVFRLMKQRPIYGRPLTVAEVQRRIHQCWQPYHDALRSLLDDTHRRFGALWHLNVHSMGDDAYKTLGLPEKPLADFVLGDLDGTTADEPTMLLIETVLRDHGFGVVRNDPFKGVEIIRRSGRPAEGRRALQIEVKKSCYMDRRTLQPHEDFARVQQALDAMLQALAGHVRHHA
ncbi:N-formylglutamate amidohydrolase [Aquincola sp. S2]|uniref:N-formylglutamate amidohydrolase n=1 Tax=Pseudaquabacterium terrae TaxID=2732868 RepID=A0ABX2EJP9_9BURK|nr:N-formylglutamate amidohydrolase [Aquabacterium terrae]NRF68828.1 N-formylglutamate amidohydrolase [Aquabacterium terrae]